MQDEYQNIDLPRLIDEWQAEGNRGAHDIHRHQKGAARQAIGKSADNGRYADIGDHLDRERRPQHRPGIAAGYVIGQQTERHGRKARAHQCDDLRTEKMAIGAIGEHGKQGRLQRIHILQGGYTDRCNILPRGIGKGCDTEEFSRVTIEHRHDSHPAIVKRLNRAGGHLRSIVEMIESQRPCADIAQQLQAVEKAIVSAKKALIHDHLDHCLSHTQATEGMGSAVEEFRTISKYL